MPVPARPPHELTPVERQLLKASARHMSDAKWLALFSHMRQQGVRELRWKLVAVAGSSLAQLPAEADLLPERFADVLPAPYSRYRDIEWVEVPNPSTALAALLQSSSKQFPWEATAGGLKVSAYSWQPE